MFPKIHIEIERWKFNKNYQLYVSNLGNFKNKSKEDIKPMIERGGYLVIPLCNNKQGKIKYIQAHRIVMETWCPRADMWKAKLTVDHLDHNKRHNTIKNLQWVTAEENLRRAAADFITDDKDKIIQSLKDKVRNLEIQLSQQFKEERISAGGYFNFHSWDEVKKFLISLNPSYVNAKIETMQKAIRKSANNKTLYCGYVWKIG